MDLPNDHCYWSIYFLNLKLAGLFFWYSTLCLFFIFYECFPFYGLTFCSLNYEDSPSHSFGSTSCFYPILFSQLPGAMLDLISNLAPLLTHYALSEPVSQCPCLFLKIVVQPSNSTSVFISSILYIFFCIFLLIFYLFCFMV